MYGYKHCYFFDENMIQVKCKMSVSVGWTNWVWSILRQFFAENSVCGHISYSPQDVNTDSYMTQKLGKIFCKTVFLIMFFYFFVRDI